MALPPLALVSELADWIGVPISDELDVKRAEGALRLASTLVRSYVDTEWHDAVTGESTAPDGVADIVLQVASRGYLNPEGWGNERLDDWGGGQRPVTEWGLYLTPTEKRLLDDFRPRKTAGIGVMGTTRTPARSVCGWVPVVDAPPFPWY